MREVDQADQRFMRRAIALARRGAGRVSPNPLVGAVIVKKGEIIGEGYHLFERKEHAEMLALRRAGSKAQGASLYLNLEPCTHHGRTPPCVAGIIEAGIREVFLSVKDPNPRVDGKGIQILRQHGIRVEEGLLREEALELNQNFFHYIQTGQPFVTLKLALTLDGRIATRTGESRWITGERSRREVHRLRYQSDAILVGIGTVLEDNPALNVRWKYHNRITKVILDSRLQTPVRARLFASGDPVVLFHERGRPVAGSGRFTKGTKIIGVSEELGLLQWPEILEQLGRLEITSLMIEGGGRVAASALRAGVVGKLVLFYGPIVIGGDGRSGVEELGVEKLQEAVKLEKIRLKRLAPDFMVEGYIR